jgi:hypothetical protein
MEAISSRIFKGASARGAKHIFSKADVFDIEIFRRLVNLGLSRELTAKVVRTSKKQRPLFHGPAPWGQNHRDIKLSILLKPDSFLSLDGLDSYRYYVNQFFNSLNTTIFPIPLCNLFKVFSSFPQPFLLKIHLAGIQQFRISPSEDLPWTRTCSRSRPLLPGASPGRPLRR